MEPLTPTEFYKMHLHFLYDYLVGSDDDGTLNPDRGLADSWEPVDDGQGWVFHIREGITWQNGDPITAQDVEFQIERLLNPDIGAGSNSTFVGLVGTMDNVTVIDNQTIEIRTTGTDISLPFLLSNHGLLDGFIVPSEYFKSLGSDHSSQLEAFLENPVGSGPYKVVESVPGSHILFEAYEGYWGGTPRFPGVRLVEIPEESTRVAALEVGEVHIIETSRLNSPGLGDSGFTIHTKEGASTVGLVMHEQWVAENPLSSLDFRRGINHAIDRDAISDTIFYGQTTPAHTWRVGSAALGFVPGDPPTYDPDLAQQLISDSGFEGASITLLGFERQGMPEAREMMEAVTGMFQAVGLDATLEWTDQGVVFETWFGYPDHPTRSPMMEKWGPSISMNNTGNNLFPHQTALFIYYPDSLAMVTSYPEMTELIDSWSTAASADEYSSITSTVQDSLVENSIEIVLFEIADVYASSGEISLDLWPQDLYQFSWNLPDLVVER
jgi:peptide/nickel transport system substrate-binding protein